MIVVFAAAAAAVGPRTSVTSEFGEMEKFAGRDAERTVLSWIFA